MTADDLRNRLIAACAEVGQESQTTLHGEFIHVGTLTFTIIARIGAETVDVRCGSSHDPYGPWMLGHGDVPLSELGRALRKTLNEREQVLSAMKLGIEGPYRFERSEWRKPE
jgi:hypothetical protein